VLISECHNTSAKNVLNKPLHTCELLIKILHTFISVIAAGKQKVLSMLWI